MRKIVVGQLLVNFSILNTN